MSPSLECLQQGKVPPPVLGCPWVHNLCIFVPDWLHVVDLGVGADLAGGVLELLLQLRKGRLGKRVAEMWQSLQAFYSEHGVPDRLKGLVLQTWRQGRGKAPKLRAMGVVCRRIHPWLLAEPQMVTK